MLNFPLCGTVNEYSIIIPIRYNSYICLIPLKKTAKTEKECIEVHNFLFVKILILLYADMGVFVYFSNILSHILQQHGLLVKQSIWLQVNLPLCQFVPHYSPPCCHFISSYFHFTPFNKLIHTHLLTYMLISFGFLFDEWWSYIV